MKERKEPTVEEVQFDPSALDAEQSAAWRDVVWKIASNAIQLGWAFWVYLLLRFGYDLLRAWLAA